ncbi:MAG: PEP-CTERM sorting domain-containing protein [Tepidisphaeraceae bacterium]|jgi:hypothetical protein
MHLHGIAGSTRRRLARAAVMATAPAVVGLFAGQTQAQMTFGNTSTLIRPLVWVRDISSANASSTALGLFDTGSPGTFVPAYTTTTPKPSNASTNSVWGIAANAATAAAGTNSANWSTVGVPTSFNVGGIMGGAFSGPEVGAPTTHTFTTVTKIANTSLTGRLNISPSLTYYNTNNNFVNVGMDYADAAGGAPAYVVEVDPTNASWMPFAFNNRAAGATNDAGAALNAPRNSGEQATSSLSFYFASDPQAPTPTANADPGFLTVLPLQPATYNPTNGVNTNVANFTTTTNAAIASGGSLGARPLYIVNAGGPNPFNLPLGTYIVDTGAPITASPTSAIGLRVGAGLLGTNILNQYGQYFDLTNNTLMLFAPTMAADQKIVGPGILFDVGRSTTGLANTGVNQLATNGSLPVNTSGGGGAAIAGDGIAGQQASAIFSTQLTHSNKAYVNGIAALGLQATDHMNGLSMGADQPGIPTEGLLLAGADKPAVQNPSSSFIPSSISNALNSGGPVGSDNCALLFSVDGNSQGIAGSGVAAQAALGKQSAQMFIGTTPYFNDTGHLGETNTLKYSGDLLGLGPNAGPTTAAAGRGHVDQLGDFVIESQNGYYNATTYQNTVAPSTVQRNIDPTITSETLAPLNTGSGITLPSTTATPVGTPPNILPPPTSTPPTNARGDILGSTFDTYFTLDNASPTLGKNGNSSADILVNNQATAGGTTGYHVFAKASTMGLNPADQIDALALSGEGLGENFGLVPGKPNTSTDMIGNFDANFFGNFQGVDAFNGGSSDYDLFTLARGSPDLGIFDPTIGRDLSAADVFVSDFDGTFALYATAESLGLNATSDEVTGLKPLPLSDLPEPATFALLAVGAAMLLSRRSRR